MRLAEPLPVIRLKGGDKLIINNVELLDAEGTGLRLADWPDVNHRFFTSDFGSLKSNQPDTLRILGVIRRISDSDYAAKMLPQHGTEVVTVTDDLTDFQPAIPADALVHFRINGTGRKPALISNSADCYTVLLANSNRSAIGIIHCSLKTTVNGLLEKVMAVLSANFNGKRFAAGIMPGICGNCYEIGTPEEPICRLANFRSGYFDLRKEIIDRLSRFPGLVKSISYSNVCSKEDERIFSHRGGDNGRSPCFIAY